MALRSKLRPLIPNRYRPFSTSILNPDSKTPLSSKEKSRAALNLLRFEKNPERILDICRAASLTPEIHLDRVAYSEAISKLKEFNYYEGIRGFVKESLARPDFKTEKIFSHFIVLYGQAGLIKDAIKLFDEMPAMGLERNEKTLNSLLFSCVLAGDYGEMKRIYADFPKKYGIVPNLDTYNTVLKGFCDSGSANSSHSILAEMERKSVKPNATTFTTVIAGFYKEEKFTEVGKMMQLMKKFGLHAGISIYNVRIQSLCKLKRTGEAKLLLDGLIANGMKPNSATYNHLIFGYCVEGGYDMAKSLFEEMQNMNLKPDADCYFTLIYYLCKGGEFESAFYKCKECMERGWVPNFSTMHSLVNGLAGIEKVKEAKELIGQVKEKFSRNADKWTEIEEGLAKKSET